MDNLQITKALHRGKAAHWRSESHAWAGAFIVYALAAYVLWSVGFVITPAVAVICCAASGYYLFRCRYKYHESRTVAETD